MPTRSPNHTPTPTPSGPGASAPADPVPTPHPDRLLAELDRLEARVAELDGQLAHAQRLATLGTLAATIAHEYNNILTPMLSYAQMALARPDDAALMRKAVEKALDGGTRATRISAALLGFAREDPDAEPDHAHLPTTLEHTLACLGRDLGKDGITLEQNLPDAHAAIPPGHLQQVLLNLILNARKALTPRGGKLRITAHIQNGLINLCVSDNGPGIPEHLRPKLFQPFATAPHPEVTPQPPEVAPEVSSAPPEPPETAAENALPPNRLAGDVQRPVPRGEPRTTDNETQDNHREPSAHSAGDTDPPGNGLGLALCRSLIEQAGGSIDLLPPGSSNTPASTPTPSGRGAPAPGSNPAPLPGATFCITLPAA